MHASRLKARRAVSGPGSAFVLGLAVAALCAYLLLTGLAAAPRASAAPTVPAFFGEVASTEVPGGSGGGLRGISGVAVDHATEDIYVATYPKVVELSPYGSFILSFGSEVDKTKVAKREAEEAAKEPVSVTEEEEDICTAASRDTCGEGSGGSSRIGQFSGAAGVAVQQSTGDVFVVDRNNHRVQKFDSSGRFLLMFGKDVNKAKAEAVAAKEAKGEAPTAAELREANRCLVGEACQAGRTGTGEGAFEYWPGGAFIAAGGPSGHVYVGDKGRIEVFDGEGEYVEAISLSALSAVRKVDALAVDSAGDVFFGDQGIAGVHEVAAGGTLSSTVFDSSSAGITEVALDGSGHLYAGDRSPSFRVLEYELASPSASPAEFAGVEPGQVVRSEALAIDGHGAVYLGSSETFGKGTNALKMYGSLAAMEAAFGPPPPLAPSIDSESVLATPGETTATLQAQINPQFRETSYQFEYGLEPCSAGHCAKAPASPLALGSVTKTEHQALAPITVQLGAIYHYRATATNAKGSAQSAEQIFTVDSALAPGPTGLPDGRVFEQVSPPYKNGNFVDFIHPVAFGLAEAGGNAVVYPMSGAAGTSYSGTIGDYVARRIPGIGWTTEATVPRQRLREYSVFDEAPLSLVPSSNFAKFLFASATPYSPESGPTFANIYLSESPANEPAWLAKPTIENPIPGPNAQPYFTKNAVIAGAAPSLSTVYFAYAGTLLPEDSGREPHVGEGISDGSGGAHPWGFYEWHEGTLHEAGTLPNGTLNPYGAVPAAMGYPGVFGRQSEFEAGDYDNWLSDEGRRALFLSPDPIASAVTRSEELALGGGPCREAGVCASEPPELYLREVLPSGGHKVTLVSASELPGHAGDPAPSGPLPMADVTGPRQEDGSYAFASPDGSQVFFASVDRLTTAAPENSEPKEYDYSVAANSLTYLAGVSGPIIQVDSSGSDFLFVDTASRVMSLDLWQAGSAGGTVRVIAGLPPSKNGGVEVRYSHLSSNGSVAVFTTDSPLPGGFNNRGEDQTEGNTPREVYRYAVGNSELKCLSCPPKGVTPVGDANMSYNNYAGVGEEVPHPNGESSDPQTTLEARGMSADGSMVFFDTPNALVPQAINGVRNVYEWENGKTYLLSSGSSTEPSYYLDNSESGGDVFFATQAGLVPGDTDEAYDVYDARIPRPGDNPPPSVVPCKGSVCQGPPSVPQLLGAPASATFSGPGNPTPPAAKTATKRKGKALTRTQKLKRALRACKRQRKRKKRAICERQARKRYGRARGKRARRSKASRRGRR